MCSASPKILVLFVCKSCRSSFSLIDEFIKHKTTQHYDEFKQINCVIFEEQISYEHAGENENHGVDRIPTPMLSFEPEAHYYYTITDQMDEGDDWNLAEDPLTSASKVIALDPLVCSRKFIKCEEPHQNIQIDAVVGNFCDGSAGTVNEIRIPSVKRMCNPSVNLRRLTPSQILKASSSYQNETVIKLEHEDANDVSCSASTPVAVPFPVSDIYFDFDDDSKSDSDPFFNQQPIHSSIPKNNDQNPAAPLPSAVQLNQDMVDIPTTTTTTTTTSSDVEPTADLTCKFCFRKFKYEDSLFTHVGICLLNRSNRSRCCVLCNKLYCEPRYLQEHMIRVHGTEEEKEKAYKLKCQVCSKKFLLHGELLIHMNSHLDVDEDSKPFKCQECGRSFLTKRYLTRHLGRLHSKRHAALPLSVPDLDLNCKLCLKKYKSQSELSIHLSVCKLYYKGGDWVCVSCNKLFSSAVAFKGHMLIFHATEEEKKKAFRFKCQHCTKKFLRNREFLVHMESHKGKDERSKPFKCKECDRSFLTKDYLRKHFKRVHKM